jgi:uncharacterized protein
VASDLLDRLQRDLTSARRAQDRDAMLVLSTTLADIRNREIELRRDLGDEDVVEVLRRAIKRRRESSEMFRKGERPELAEREEREVAVLEQYLPAAVDPDTIRAAVRDAIAGGATTIGAVMGKVVPAFRGRAEGSVINAIAREELARNA